MIEMLQFPEFEQFYKACQSSARQQTFAEIAKALKTLRGKSEDKEFLPFLKKISTSAGDRLEPSEFTATFNDPKLVKTGGVLDLNEWISSFIKSN